MINQKINYL